MKVKQVAVEALIPYAQNARKHSDAQVSQIAASIGEFGFTNPILTDGENGVIAGHGRLLAARELGLEKVPVIELAGLTDVQKRAYILADNKLALNAGWDDELLALELGDLQELGAEGLTGFTEDEIDAALNGGDVEPIDTGDGEDRSGVNVPTMRFGSTRVEMSVDEMNRLEAGFMQYMDAYGGSAGFASYLMDGKISA